MDKYTETFNTWNTIASLYQDKFMNMDLYNETYDYVCTQVTEPNAKLLEVGCGPGNITHYLLTKRPDFSIHGIDIAPNMIELAKLNNPKATFEVMDSRHLNRLKTTYNAIICGFCIPYLSTEETNELIANAADLLQEKGLLYLSFVEGDPAKSDYKVGSGGRVFFHYHDLEALKKQLILTSFNDINVFNVAFKTSETTVDIHTILVAKKQ